ncbi:SagB/ThcOx family dehydrogenase [Chloroflexota bacterium]
MPEPFIILPTPCFKGEKSLEETILARRSVRRFKSESLTLMQLSQLLWSSQGNTGNKRRTIPSAGATLPLEVYIFVGEQTVGNLKAGIYHYEPQNHSLSLYITNDLRQDLAEAALGQSFIASCPLSMVICALFSRTTSRYGKRGEMYVHMEAGHLGQNVALQAVALGLATVMVGAFIDDKVSSILKLAEGFKPLYIIPVGKPA